MTANVDRTYRTDPEKFSGDLAAKITTEAAAQLRTWEAQGQLPRWIRIKNRFRHHKVALPTSR